MPGDLARYLDLIHHAPGFTLTAPDGGSPVQFAVRRSDFLGWQSPFADAAAALDLTAVHNGGDTAILVMIERQHARIADLPDRDLSMRVTSVHRRTASGSELVHRHAAPLVRPVSMEKLSSLADE
jgi:hypothetical protein